MNATENCNVLRPPMQTDYLRYFIDVATLGSMSAAAKKNFMSPQGISRSIAALEAELGCELFLRDSNKVVLTRFGERLLEEARGLIAHENGLRKAVLDLRTDALKRSRMYYTCYCSPVFFESSLLFPISGFNRALYGKVQFLQRSTPQVVELLIDAARVTQPEIVVAGGVSLYDLFADENVRIIQSLRDAGYEYRPFMSMSDFALVPEYSPLARCSCLSKTELRRHNLAVAAAGGMERAVTRHIGSDSIYVSTGDSAFRSRLCRMGEALTFVPGVSLVYGTPEGTVAVPLEEPYVMEIGFVARADAFESGALADALERLEAFYERYDGGSLFTFLGCDPAKSLFT